LKSTAPLRFRGLRNPCLSQPVILPVPQRSRRDGLQVVTSPTPSASPIPRNAQAVHHLLRQTAFQAHAHRLRRHARPAPKGQTPRALGTSGSRCGNTGKGDPRPRSSPLGRPQPMFPGDTQEVVARWPSALAVRASGIPRCPRPRMDTTQEVAAFAAALRQLLQNTSPGPCVSRPPARNGPKSPNHQADVLSRIANQLTQSALSAQACIQRMDPKAGVRIHPSIQLHDNKTPVFPFHQMRMISQSPRDIPPPGGPQQLIRRLVCSPMLVLSGIDGSMTVCPRPLDLAAQTIGGDDRVFEDGGWKHPLDTLQQHAGGGRPQSQGSRHHAVAQWRLQHQAGWEGHQTRPRTRKLP